MSKLKRCPFCGDEVEMVATGLYHWKYAIHHKSKTECIIDANAFALPYEEEDAVRMWNTRADRKTENSSEIKVEPTWVGTTYGRFEDEPQTDCADTNLSENPTSSTRSILEQVDKDINVRSKDEPQTDCNGCKFIGTYDTEFPCANCSRKTKDYYAKTEPQTDCAWR